MIVKIWRILVQILFYNNDLNEIIKPFFENLNNENINDEKYISLLETFSKNQLEVLYGNKIMKEEKFNLLVPKNQKENQSSLININTKIEEIISGDKIKEFQEFLQEKDITTFNTITKSFLEVKKMKIPLIQYCIMKKAIKCFKFLLVNGLDDPNKTMEENIAHKFTKSNNKREINNYKWDCMATAIFFGNKEMIKILEEKGIEKGENPTHIEAAILSYRNQKI